VCKHALRSRADMPPGLTACRKLPVWTCVVPQAGAQSWPVPTGFRDSSPAAHRS